MIGPIFDFFRWFSWNDLQVIKNYLSSKWLSFCVAQVTFIVLFCIFFPFSRTLLINYFYLINKTINLINSKRFKKVKFSYCSEVERQSISCLKAFKFSRPVTISICYLMCSLISDWYMSFQAEVVPSMSSNTDITNHESYIGSYCFKVNIFLVFTVMNFGELRCVM